MAATPNLASPMGDLIPEKAGGSKETKNNPRLLQSYVTYDTLRAVHCC
jgi:hypothetical protein